MKISTPLYTATLYTGGGILRSFELDKFKATVERNSPDVNLVNKASAAMAPLGLVINGQPSWNMGQWSFDGSDINLESGEATLTFVGEMNGIRISRAITFHADTYLMDEKVTLTSAAGTPADPPAEQTTRTSHGAAAEQAPAGLEALAHTEGAPVAAMADESRKLYGVQWHPEVKHSPLGQKLIENFLHRCAALPNDWDASSIIEDQVKKIREQVGDAEVICGLSGGVDSAVAAALVHKAIGDQLTCVFVDHGLLRKGEVEQVKHDFVAATGIRLITVDAADDFLEALKGVSEPERKRKIIGEKFIRTFEKAQRQVLEEAGARGKEVKFLVQGTLYPDVVESGGGDGAANIKSHHNVGGLPEDIKFQLIEPLRTLFKDEVRAIGTELGLPDEIVWRQPFPGPGLGIRIIGEITKERLDLLREADAIAREELSKAGLDRDIWQCPVVLLADVHSVGVQGDERTYGSPIVLRPVSSEDAMTADWSRVPYDVLATISTRITNECRQINRGVLDCTSKPPATIEWE